MQSEPNNYEFDLLIKLGLSPIPLMKNKKRPAFDGWQKFCSHQPDEKTIAEWKSKGEIEQVGLCLGTHVKDDLNLIAIDIDAEDITGRVIQAVGQKTVMKKGNKGLTLLVLANPSIVNQKIKRRDINGKADRAPSVEILCFGSQTVIPPSIHPDTGRPYIWMEEPLHLGFPHNLAVIDLTVIDEIEAICQRKDEKFADLNEMVWLGEGKGGNTHDVCVAAVGTMVSRSWPDHAIHRRINRAKREACERNGDDYNWPQADRIIQEWIDSAKQKGMEGSSKKEPMKRIPPERLMVDWAIDTLGGQDNVVTTKGVLRTYVDGYWQPVDLEELKKKMYMQDLSLNKKSADAALSILHTLTTNSAFGFTPYADKKNDPKRQRICLKNGTINIKTGELERHAKEHELISRLDINWNENSTCPTWDRVLMETVADEHAANFVNEFFALTLVPDMSFQKVLVLVGGGGNGKSTLTNLLVEMHDPDTVGSVSITDLSDERKRTSLIGKLLNVSNEQGKLREVSDSYLKKITGGDPVDCRKLYNELLSNVHMDVRFIESANELPKTSDTSDGMRRRLAIIRCDKKPVNPDINLRQKLLAEREGILFKWVTQSLPNLYKRGKFHITHEMEAEVDDYIKSNDPVALWREERLDPRPTEKGTPTGELYGDFKNWCDVNGFKFPFTSVLWGQKMNAAGYPVLIKKVGAMSVRARMVNLRSY